MKQRIAIMTDSNSGLTADEADALNVTVLPMPVIINNQEYYEGKNLSSAAFYRYLTNGAEVVTSLPSIQQLLDCWQDMLKEAQHVLYIPMTSHLSSSCNIARMQAEAFHGRVQVLDSCRISLPLKQLVMDASRYADMDLSMEELVSKLEASKQHASIFLLVDRLTYLQRSGRVSNRQALLGGALGIKPILHMTDAELSVVHKVRTTKKGEERLVELLQAAIADYQQTHNSKVRLQIAYSGEKQDITNQVYQRLSAIYPNQSIDICPLTFSIASHVGPHALGVGYSNDMF